MQPDATTPIGARSTRHSTPRLTSSTSPLAICGSEQAESATPIVNVRALAWRAMRSTEYVDFFALSISPRSRDTASESSSVRPGASPSQNGIVGGWPCASATRMKSACEIPQTRSTISGV